MNAIECTHLSRSFGRNAALSDVTFSVPAGSFFALLGPNGAGKSTCLKIFLNLIAPTGGEAVVLGKKSTNLRAADFQRIGYIAEGQDLPEWMTATQLVAYCRSFYPKWDHDLEKRLTKDFQIPMDRPLSRVSRGQRMQTSLLSTLPFRPELLILDEPFSGLDPLVRDELLLGFLELPNNDRPGTILLSSHDIDEVERLTDELAFIAEGKLVIREGAEQAQARFRRIEATSQGSVSISSQPSWLEFRQPAPNVVRFILTDYKEGESDASLARILPQSAIRVERMTLREIFVCLSRHQKQTSVPA